MSKLHVATIITVDHFDKAYSMLASLRKFLDVHLHILTTHNNPHKSIDPPENPDVTVYGMNDLFKGPLAKLNRLSYAKYNKAIYTKDKRPELIAPADYLRWAMKAGFVHHLMQDKEMVIFCDNDLFFYQDPTEILEFCSKHSFVVSPHWRTIHTIASDEMQFNFLHGLYNGGFFTVTTEGMPILEWWAEQCCIECSASSKITYVDQKYLDLVPLYFDNVGILRHKGCNVAAWNTNYLERTTEGDEVLVDGDPIIFIHYSPITVDWIENGNDYLLTGHLKEYEEELTKQRMAFFRSGKQKYMSKQIKNDLI